VTGTGKSTELIRRMKERIEQGVPEDRIGFVSFTKAAALELASRVGVKPGGNISTIHSMAFRLSGILKDQVIDRLKLREFSKVSGIEIAGANPDEAECLSDGDAYLALYQLYHAKAHTKENFTYAVMYGHSDRPGELAQFVRFCNGMDKFKLANGYVDFNDMLKRALGEPGPDVDVLFVDEAQDLSPLQWKLVRYWCKFVKEVHVAGDDDQCQPVGTLISTPHGDIKIEDIKDGSRVISYEQKRGRFCAEKIKVSKRNYQGSLYVVTTNSCLSKYTTNHKCMVKYRKDIVGKNLRVVYLMEKGGMFRIGQTKLVKINQSGGVGLYPVRGLREEKADKLWLLKIFSDENETIAEEQLISVKYGIPRAVFDFEGSRSKNQSGKSIWKKFRDSGIDFKGRANKLLINYGKSYFYPYSDICHNRGAKFNKCHAINLMPEIHQIAEFRKEVPYYDKRNKLNWQNFDLRIEQYKGDVYSLEVEKTGTYIADGIYTHNSIYVWGGADPTGMPKFERKLKASRVVLNKSYRVPFSVHELGQRVVTRIKDRVAKKYTPKNEIGIVCKVASVDMINIKHGDDVLILFRNHFLRRDVEERVVELGLPYVVDSGKPGLLHSFHAKAARSWEILVRDWNKTGHIMLHKADYNNLLRNVKPRVKHKIEQKDLGSVVKYNWDSVLDASFGTINYLNKIYSQHGSLNVEPTIHLSTIHGSKGREADHVVLVNGMSNRSVGAMLRDPDSEYRTFYVGITRAKHQLDIILGENALGVL